jgi:hypothetical protein
MPDLQRAGVQRDPPGQGPGGSVNGIADDRQAPPGRLRAELVRPPRLRPEPELAYLAQFRENLGDFRVPNLQNPRFFRSGNRPQGM